MATGAAVIGGLGLISGIVGGREADKTAQRNADLMRRESAEAARRLGEQQTETLALTKAGAAASGMRTGTTPVGGEKTSSELYIDKMQSEFKKELNWAKTAGASAASIEEQRGRAARWQGYASALGGAGSIFGGLYDRGYMRGGPSNWLNRANVSGNYIG